jgi:cell division protein FtsL
MNARLICLGVIALALVVTSVSVVFVKHRSRTLFVELQALERNRDRLNTEWTQLQLESSAWATHDRLEQVASKQLKFHVPAPSDMEVVESRQ